MASIRSFGVERIGALSDGVVAIALTILVLELKFPEVLSDDAELWASLAMQAPELVGWVISFVMITIVWYDQHYLFAHSERFDTGLLVINLAQLAAISLIPAAAHLIGRFPEDPASAVIFSGVMLLNGFVMAVNATYLARHDALHGTVEARFLHRRGAYHAISFTAMAVGAITLGALAHPLMGTALWAIKPVGFSLYHRAYNRRLDKSMTHQASIRGE